METIQNTFNTLQNFVQTMEEEKAKLTYECNELMAMHVKEKQLEKKVDEYSSQLKVLEADVSMLKSENEALKTDATKQDKELTIAVAALKLRDEQYAAVDLELVGVKSELSQLHDTIAQMEKNEHDMKQEVAKQKEQIQEYEIKVEEKNNMIDHTRHNAKLEGNELNVIVSGKGYFL